MARIRTTNQRRKRKGYPLWLYEREYGKRGDVPVGVLWHQQKALHGGLRSRQRQLRGLQ